MGLIIYFMVECISKVPNKFLSIFCKNFENSSNMEMTWVIICDIIYGNELLFNFLFSGKSGTLKT